MDENATLHLRGALNHPIPPILETIPILLLSSSTAFDVVARISDDEEMLRKAGGYSLTSGLVAATGASVYGILDYLRKGQLERRVVPRRDFWDAVVTAPYLLSFFGRTDDRADGFTLALSGLGAALIGLSRYLDTVRLDQKGVEDAFRSGGLAAADKWGRVGYYRAIVRSVLELDALHVEKNLARKIRKGVYDVRVNQDFEGTIRGCAERQSTWINEEIIQVYIDLHRAGKAHSVEAYQDNNLVGGLYGVALGGAFRVESQFHRARDASKICFVHLVDRLRERGYTLLDLYAPTEHLARFGAVAISEKEYLAGLRRALQLQRSFV